MSVVWYSIIHVVVCATTDEVVNVHKMNPTPKWRQEFEKYLLSIPSYYYSSMRNGTYHWNPWLSTT